MRGRGRTGTGIVSGTAAAGAPGEILSVGYADGNTDSGTPAGPNQILVQYTLAGDANFEGSVDSADLLAVIQNFNKTGTDWSHGNFTYIASGQSTVSADLLLVIQNFDQTLPPPAGSASNLGAVTIPLGATAGDQVDPAAVRVPEPGSAGMALVAGAGFLARRRRCGGGKMAGWVREEGRKRVAARLSSTLRLRPEGSSPKSSDAAKNRIEFSPPHPPTRSPPHALPDARNPGSCIPIPSGYTDLFAIF